MLYCIAINRACKLYYSECCLVLNKNYLYACCEVRAGLTGYYTGDEEKLKGMATHGQFGEFNPQREDWTSYTERLQEYFIANGLEDAAKKKAVLLSIVGAETYQLMRNLTAPAKPTEKSFDQLIKLVEEHHHPAPSVILQRFKFASRRQKPGESIATFVSELRRLSEHCNYGQTLDEMLRDRVVCGIADGRLQRRLLAEPELTLKKAFELAQAQETADQGAQHLQQNNLSWGR